MDEEEKSDDTDTEMQIKTYDEENQITTATTKNNRVMSEVYDFQFN